MRESIVRAVDEAVSMLVDFRQEAEQETEEALFWAHFASIAEHT